MTTDALDTNALAQSGIDRALGLLDGFREHIEHVQPTLTGMPVLWVRRERVVLLHLIDGSGSLGRARGV